MLIIEYAIVLIVEALAVFYVVRYFYKTFADSIRRDGCGGGSASCGCGTGATKSVTKRQQPYVPPHIRRRDPGRPVQDAAKAGIEQA